MYPLMKSSEKLWPGATSTITQNGGEPQKIITNFFSVCVKIRAVKAGKNTEYAAQYSAEII